MEEAEEAAAVEGDAGGGSMRVASDERPGSDQFMPANAVRKPAELVGVDVPVLLPLLLPLLPPLLPELILAPPLPLPRRSSLGSLDALSATVPEGEAGTSDDENDDEDMEGEVAPAGAAEAFDEPARAGGNLKRARVLKDAEPPGRAPLAVGGSDGDEAGKGDESEMIYTRETRMRKSMRKMRDCQARRHTGLNFCEMLDILSSMS
jgi:hypothetical protein